MLSDLLDPRQMTHSQLAQEILEAMKGAPLAKQFRTQLEAVALGEQIPSAGVLALIERYRKEVLKPKHLRWQT